MTVPFDPSAYVGTPTPNPLTAEDYDTVNGSSTHAIYGEPTNYGSPLYGPGLDQPPKEDLASRLWTGAKEMGKSFLNDLNVAEPGITPREKLYRIANVGSFFLPAAKLGQTAGLGIRMLVKGAETGAISGGLAALRGQPITPNALLGGGLGATIEALLTKGRYAGNAARSTAWLNKAKTANFTDLNTTPLNDGPWGINSAMHTDASNLKLPDARNLELHQELGDKIRELGYDPQEVSGFGPGQTSAEKAWFVPGMTRQQNLELAKAYGQAYTMTNDGLWNLSTGDLSPLKPSKTKFGADVDPATDFYTKFDSHDDSKRFSFGIGDPQTVGMKSVQRGPTSVENKLTSQMATNAGPTIVDRALGYPLASKLHDWYADLVNHYVGMDDVNKMLGKPENVLNDQAVAAQLLAGHVAFADEFIKHAVYDWNDRTKVIHEGLLPILQNGLNDGEFGAFQNFGLAKRYLALAEQRGYSLPDGLTVDNLQQHVAEAPSHFQPVFDQIQSWRDAVVDNLLVKPGVITKDLAEKIKATSPDYVPLVKQRFDELTDNLTSEMQKVGVYNPLKTISGITGKIEPWLDEMIRQTYGFSRIGHIQDLAGTFINRLREIDPSAAIQFAEKQKGVPNELSGMASKTIAALRDTDPALAKAAEAHSEELMGMIAPHSLSASGYLSIPTITKGFRDVEGKFHTPEQMQAILDDITNNPQNELFGKELPQFTPGEQGGREWWKVTNPTVWKTFSALNPPDVGPVTRIAAAFARVLHAGAILSPSFLARTPERHFMQALVTGGESYPVKDALNNVISGFADAIGKTDMYHQAVASGALRTKLEALSGDSLGSDMLQHYSDMQSGLASKLSNVILHPINALESLSWFMDSGVRTGIYKTAYQNFIEHGVVPAEATRQAAVVARDASVDFSRHGASTNAIRMVVPFWNAAIQSYDQLFRAFQRDPVGTSARASVLTGASLALYMHNRNDPEYAQLPEWEKNMFWHIKAPAGMPMVGDKWLRFPKPFDLGMIFGSGPERFLEYLDTQDRGHVDSIAAHYAERLFQDMLPVPTIVRPILETAMNKSLLTGKTIESGSMSDIEPKFRTYPHTSQIAQQISNFIGNKLDPIQVENMIQGYTGGLGKAAVDATDGFSRLAAATSFSADARDIPVLNAFLSQFPRQIESVEKLYQFADRAKVAEATKTRLEQSMRLDDLYDYYQQKGVLIGAQKELAPTMKALAQIRQERDIISRDATLSNQQRNQMLDQLQREILAISASVNPLISLGEK